MTTLLISSRSNRDNERLGSAAIARGWQVERISGIAPPDMEGEVCLYVEALFADTIAARCGLSLVRPAADLPPEFLRRNVRMATYGEARQLQSPMFVKPPNDKSFPAHVYPSGAELPPDYPAAAQVLIATPVTFDVEYRGFICDRDLRTSSPYARGGRRIEPEQASSPSSEHMAAIGFLESLLAVTEVDIPPAVVIDVGWIAGAGWAVVEANGAWASSIYECAPDAVLEVLRCAVTPLPT